MKLSGLLLIILLISACQPTVAPVSLPTVMNLDALATDESATQIAQASPTPQPLPPTFTPTPIETPTSTPEPEQATRPPEEAPLAASRIYYIYNGDSIVELAPDGLFEDLVPVPHIGMSISGLSGVDNVGLLAYVAPGSGSAHEVFVTDKSGQIQQVSQLGYSEVQAPVWSMYGNQLAFIAAQQPGAPMGIYTTWPGAQEQQLIQQLPSTNMANLVWGPDDEWLFYTDDTIYAVNIYTGEIAGPLTEYNGFGSDFSLAHSPITPQLYYLKMWNDLNTGQNGGILHHLLTLNLPETDSERTGARLYVDTLRYSPDGEYLLAAGKRGIWVQNQASQTLTQIVQTLTTNPYPVFSPDASQVAYVGTDANDVPQIYIIDRQGGTPTQITQHQTGTISDLVWLSE